MASTHWRCLSLAVPVRDHDGSVLAAIGVVLSSDRADELDTLVRPLRAAAGRIEQVLKDGEDLMALNTGPSTS